MSHVDLMCFFASFWHVWGRCEFVSGVGLFEDAQSIAGSIIPAVVGG